MTAVFVSAALVPITNARARVAVNNARFMESPLGCIAVAAKMPIAGPRVKNSLPRVAAALLQMTSVLTESSSR
jgi:hypothetical protein